MVAYILYGVYTIAKCCNLSIFKVQINIYVNGVFDLFHIGHLDFFKNAKKRGTDLIVGIHSDADVESYKRKPIMTMVERVEAVSGCKYVDRIIDNAPLIATSDFIQKYNIHNVVISAEYESPTDHYYTDPRKMNILVPIPRSDKMSTTDLMKRICEYQ